MADVYEDPRIRAGEQELELRWYYFPLGTKRIPWNKITKVEEHDMGSGLMGGRWRIWGSGDLKHWMPLDVRRPKKQWMFIIHVEDSSVVPCVTPDDPPTFKAALEARGIEVKPSSGYRD